MRQRTAQRRDYWSWLGPLCLAAAGVFVGAILGQMTLNQMLLSPWPIFDPATRMIGRFVGSAVCLFFPVAMILIALIFRKPGWLPNILAFFGIGFLAYLYSAFLVGTPPL